MAVPELPIEAVRRLAMVLTNYHPQARDTMSRRVEQEEEQADRLGRTLMNCEEPFLVRRMGNSLDTLSATVCATIRHEFRSALTIASRPEILFLFLSGHGFWSAESGPVLLARDVYLHIREEGEISLRDLLSQATASAPVHLVIALDFRCLRSDTPGPAELAASLGDIPGAHSLFILDRSRGFGLGLAGALAGGLEGGGTLKRGSNVTVCGMADFLSGISGGEGGSVVYFQTTLHRNTDVVLSAGTRAAITELTQEPALEPAAREGEYLPSGTMLPGRIRIVDLLGQGGFGVVYRAEQCDLHREVAVKVLLPGPSSSTDAVLLFLREMRMVANLGHRNIIAIHQSGRIADGRPFYAMELLAGETLRQRLERRETFDTAGCVDVACQTLAGLVHAHTNHIWHRDIKPENLMLVPQGDGAVRVVILDFGIARWREEQGEDGPGEAAGTPGYSPPEQLKGTFSGDSADTYSVGVILCETLLGVRPADMDSFDALSRLAGEAGLPSRLVSVLLRSVHPEPSHRFGTARDFLDSLQGKGHEYSDTRARRVRSMQPFRFLDPFRPEDVGLFFGREAEVKRWMDRLVFSRCLLMTGAPCVGKTSLIRAGILPRCTEMGMHCVYTDCRGNPLEEAAQQLGAPGKSLLAACQDQGLRSSARIVLVFDHIEALYSVAGSSRVKQDHFEGELAELVRSDRPPVTVILVARSGFLSHLTSVRRQLLISAHNEFRVGALPLPDARRTIRGPLRLARVGIDDAVLRQLETDLLQLPSQGEHILGEPAAVPPRELQLTCSLLYEALSPETQQITMVHYQQIGGLPGVMGGLMEKTLDGQLRNDDAPIVMAVLARLGPLAVARGVVLQSQLLMDLEQRFTRPRAERVLQVLEFVRVIRCLDLDGECHLEIAHDSLADAAAAWASRDGGMKQRVRSILRTQMAESIAGRPACVSLRTLRRHTGWEEVASELQAEYDRLPLALRPAVAPRALLKESRRRVRRQLVGALAGLVGVLVVAGVLAANYGSTLFHRLADVGVAHLRFSLTERDYDGNWNRVPADRFPEFRWEIRQMGQAADNPAGTVVQPLSSSRIPDPHSKEAWVYRIEMPADRYMLVVYGRHREGEEPCGPSLVYPWNSPGFASREEDEASLTIAAVWVPTCAETRRDLVSIPEGVTFPGPHVQQPDMPLVPSQVHAFDIDDREVSQGAFRKFASTLSGLAGFSGLPVEWQLDVEEAGDPDVLPAVMVNWWQARSYCLWLGKDLPTEVEWVAAGRGVYPAGESWKREEVTRPFPWGDRVPTYGEDHIVAHHTIWRRDNGGLLRFRAPVTCCPGSRGPYPVFNLSGNVMEWVRDTVYAQPGGVVSPPPPGESGPYRLALGGHFRSAAFNELRLGSRRVLPPSAAITMMGFRCAVQSLESSAVQLDP